MRCEVRCGRWDEINTGKQLKRIIDRNDDQLVSRNNFLRARLILLCLKVVRTLYTVHYLVLYSVHCTLYSTKYCTLYSVHCIIYSVNCTFTLYTVRRTVNAVHCTLYSV